ncbi:MAG: type I glutamate--ammonia ligase [bacterium (Candidatus Stahlbacteria) CG08_land_8_20_14_0_20_40_26]|nr:MAG: type I glutamate--ammonia ligase [bacterium (Candidatus Stahlbacteria) CG08_land_8_20_14_0_20_40_26]
MRTKKDVLKETEERGIKFIDLWFSDVLGCIKNISIPKKMLSKAISEGVWFDGSSIEGFGRICESDMYLMPDIDTFVPFGDEEPKSARIICDVYSPDHSLFPDDPRYVLKRALEIALEKGYQYNVGAELEFYLFLRDEGMAPLFYDRVGYFDLEGDLALKMRKEITQDLEAIGIGVEAGHHEVGTGQHEIDLKFTDALRMADSIITAKAVIKRVAEKYEALATFMPKPVFGKPGNGMHLHQSISVNGENAFADSNDKYGLSELAYNFLGGQLTHAREMCVLLAPTVNSYKRLVSGFEAPVYVCWGQMNRSALVRVPRMSKGKLDSARLEMRCSDPTANTYLAFASLLMAGLDGVDRKLTPPPPREDNLFELDSKSLSRISTLPRSLFEALEELANSEIVKKTLGEGLTKKYYSIKKGEWDEYSSQVSNWEVEKYTSIY